PEPSQWLREQRLFDRQILCSFGDAAHDHPTNNPECRSYGKKWGDADDGAFSSRWQRSCRFALEFIRKQDGRRDDCPLLREAPQGEERQRDVDPAAVRLSLSMKVGNEGRKKERGEEWLAPAGNPSDGFDFRRMQCPKRSNKRRGKVISQEKSCEQV